MRLIGLVPGLSIVAGAASAPAFDDLGGRLLWILPLLVVVSAAACWRRATRLAGASVALGFWLSGVVLGVDAADRSLHTSLRALLDREVGGFEIESPGPEGDHDPLLVRAILAEDAAPRDGYVALRVSVAAIRIRGVWRAVEGGVTVSVGGAASVDQIAEWRAGRTLQLPIAFRRPARYLNDGVPDFERASALDGTTLLGTVKSGLLVDVVARANPIAERAAGIRAHVRRALARWIATHDAVSAAIAAAVLIGDRTGLPDGTRDALQAAGTYHVIAISGGNIAIVAAASCGLLAVIGIRGRPAAVVTIVVLLSYAVVVTAGPSVWRATVMAIAYFAARVLDHRTPVWQAASLAAAAILIVRPLDVGDPGFILTFGATTALVEGARRGAALLPRSRGVSWAVATLLGSAAVEITLIPVSAFAFSRVTSAGLVLNLLAVPAMAVVQVAATLVTLTDSLEPVAWAAGWAAHLASSALVSSAGLVQAFPWLAARVPPPDLALVAAYYAALAAMSFGRGSLRRTGAAVLAAMLVLICSGSRPLRIVHRSASDRLVRLTVFDVGQGESMLLESALGAVLVDAGGAPFGGGLDIGRRVLAPALWSRGVAALDALLVTHGDPDHIGGALAILDDFRPRRIWTGIPVPGHAAMNAVEGQASRAAVPIGALRAGRVRRDGRLTVRILHPPEPDWERRRVRNDDSVVIEIVYGDVALLLTGDVGADVERSIVPLLTKSRTRILKVAHHGSRTSSSPELLESWRPQIAIISCGRGNRFGHPAPEVLERLAAVGATVLRTDRDGQIAVETDGTRIAVHTFMERR